MALLYPILLKHYRIVLFDNLCFGGNSREGICSVSRYDTEKVELWLIEYWERIVAACNLPPRFLLAAHSFGGYQAALYASSHQERVLKLMLLSPSGFETYDPQIHDPSTFYQYRFDDLPDPPSK
jgi:pimeloyl-ACP methyl ester carboxylesterase